ncbi:MAG: cytochrome c4 [Xanthomonadales bacterium]|nr:cytochrome c4 [Gammaproteobacteria bacterium]MBT8052853.1 cytochrome c4 [Gammaproteobacteria bacterium]NND55686.1 cytochrome c4 [Xanthomonadales bacterium]NNK49997.1 cytochrome c4 [Xanthomonadales bacterium]
MSFLLRAIASSLVFFSFNAFAQGDAAAGQAKSAICAACHGVDGNSVVPNWPNLAAQHEPYLVRQITLIKSGARPVPEMLGITPGLSEQDILDLSAYFSSQKTAPGVADDTQVQLGERIYRAGNADSGVPACMACHGPAGEGNPVAGYPALAGQHAVYTSNMLTRYRSGENWGEKDANSKIMNGSAAEMTDEEIQAVASYIQGLYLAGE